MIIVQFRPVIKTKTDKVFNNNFMLSFSTKIKQLLLNIGSLSLITVLSSLFFPAMSIAHVGKNNYEKSIKKTINVSNLADKNNLIPASLAGAARSLPSGVYPASENVKTGCFSNQMMSMLTAVRNKYGRKVIITSGYRSAAHNVSVGGVKNSAHTSCAAADIKVPGINKYELARFVRTLPDRGGVGIYCHNAVHIDTGERRDWNWCKRGKKH